MDDLDCAQRLQPELCASVFSKNRAALLDDLRDKDGAIWYVIAVGGHEGARQHKNRRLETAAT